MSEIVTKQPQHVPVRVYIVLVCGLLSIFVASILIRMAQNEGVNSILIAASRVVIASLALTPLVLTRYWSDVRKLRAKDFGMALLSGAFLSLHFACQEKKMKQGGVMSNELKVKSRKGKLACRDSIHAVRCPQNQSRKTVYCKLSTLKQSRPRKLWGGCLLSIRIRLRRRLFLSSRLRRG
jgi:hypothetical protein